MFDEPVNGLDPDGILWIRNLMKALAAEGRTVFVSSHLMSEMQNTADRLIVIGRGQLLADCTMDEFIARASGQTVRVATPQADVLAKVVAEAGGSAVSGGNGTLIVSGLLADQVGALAFDHGVQLNELTVVRASLEAAFMELTADSVEYRAGAEGAQGQPAGPGSRGSRPGNSPGTGGPAMTGGADHGHHSPGRRRSCPRRPAGRGSAGPCARSSPRSARSARPTGRCSCCSRSASGSARRSARSSRAAGRSPRPRPPRHRTFTRPPRSASPGCWSSASWSSWCSARWCSAAEYSTGMIRTSLIAMPRRIVIYVAKAVAFAAVALAVSLATAFTAFYLGQALLARSHHSATLAEPGVLRAVIGSALYITLCGLFALAAAAIIRNTAGTITAMIGLLFVIPVLVNVLPYGWRDDLVRWLPTSAARAMSATVGRQDPHLFSLWGQFAVFAIYTAVLLVVGGILFRKREA